jgi:outer membrane receptor protein involved in Fe transport
MQYHIRAASTAMIAIVASIGAPALAETPAAAAAASAAVQDAQPDAEAEPNTPRGNEIVVTATKRSETLLEVPLAVTVIGADELERTNATGFADYLPSIPGVQFNPSGNVFGNAIAIRGVTDGTSSFATQQPVALMLDDTLLTLSQGAINLDYSVFGVEQINVIKGPNSTLYGASSLGGTIKVQTRRPSLTETRANGRFSAATIENGGMNYLASASVSTPLIEDVLGFEATGYYKRAGGYIDDPSTGENNINSGDTYGGRLAFRFSPTDALTIDLTGYYQKLTADGFDTFAPTTVGDLQTRPLPAGGRQRDEFLLGSLVIDYDFGGANLVSATSYFDRETFTSLDLTNTFFNLSGPPFPLTSDVFAPAKVFAQELRLVSSGSGPFSWLIGGYYSNEDYTENAVIDDANFGPLVSGTFGYKYETIAAFGEVGYEITPAIKFTAGGRYTEYETKVDFNSVGLFIPPGTEILNTGAKETDFSPRFALNYNYDTGSIYIQASRGFRLGQVNVPIITGPNDVVPAFYGSDNLWNYEIGAKTSWADGRVVLNVAAYYMDWTDIQLTRTSSTGFTFIDNAGDARVYGFEFESTIYVTESTILRANLGYINGKLVRVAPGVGAQEDARLPGSPELTFSTSLQQNFTIGENDGFVSVDYLYYGDYDDQLVAAGQPLKNGDYSKLDLRVGIDLGTFDISLFATNLLDERPILARQFFGGEDVTTIQPRTFGAAVAFSF